MDLSNIVLCRTLPYVGNTTFLLYLIMIHPGEMFVLSTFSSCLRVFVQIAMIQSSTYYQKATESKRLSFHAFQKLERSQYFRQQESECADRSVIISPHFVSTKRQEITGYLLIFRPHVKRSKLQQEEGSPTRMLHLNFSGYSAFFSLSCIVGTIAFRVSSQIRCFYVITTALRTGPSTDRLPKWVVPT